jgi:hypothetical protein
MEGLAQLRSNAVLAVKTSRGRAVSKADVQRLDSIAAGAFGVALHQVESAPLGPLRNLPVPQWTRSRNGCRMMRRSKRTRSWWIYTIAPMCGLRGDVPRKSRDYCLISGKFINQVHRSLNPLAEWPAVAIKLIAERKAREILAGMGKAKPGPKSEINTGVGIAFARKRHRYLRQPILPLATKRERLGALIWLISLSRKSRFGYSAVRISKSAPSPSCSGSLNSQRMNVSAACFPVTLSGIRRATFAVSA